MYSSYFHLFLLLHRSHKLDTDLLILHDKMKLLLFKNKMRFIISLLHTHTQASHTVVRERELSFTKTNIQQIPPDNT